MNTKKTQENELELGERSGFRDAACIAWQFHQFTCRSFYNSAHPSDDRPEPPRELPSAPSEKLPVPDSRCNPVLDLSTQRYSCRQFNISELTMDEFSVLAASAYGVSGHAKLGHSILPERPVPSGGGLYPLELYFLVNRGESIAPGVVHYHPHSHILERVHSLELPEVLMTYIFMGQWWFAKAAAVAILTGVPLRTVRKYGDRGYRYLLLEAGHVAQNLVLTAESLGLGTCCGGGFYDNELANLLTLEIEHEIPIYAVAIGHPTTIDRNLNRQA